MEQIEIEGLIVHTTPYQDQSVIGNLLTSDGIFSFLAYHKKNQKSPLSPLNLGHFFLEKKQHSSLYKIKEYSISDSFLELRRSYKHLKSAGTILQNIKLSQLSEKPSPLLYELTKTYLKKLKNSKKPQNLELSFLLKLLSHEGMLSHHINCHSCQNTPFTHIENGHYFCSTCAPNYAMALSQEDVQNFIILGFSRSFNDLEMLCLSEDFENKIKQMYQQITS